MKKGPATFGFGKDWETVYAIASNKVEGTWQIEV